MCSNTVSVCYLKHKSTGTTIQKTQRANLCLPDILHSEVEPDSEARVAGVRPNEEVKLKITDVVNAAQVSCRQS